MAGRAAARYWYPDVLGVKYEGHTLAAPDSQGGITHQTFPRTAFSLISVLALHPSWAILSQKLAAITDEYDSKKMR